MAAAPERLTVREGDAGAGPSGTWSDFAPGVCRRALRHHAGTAAMLCVAAPGVPAPLHGLHGLHGHWHDEHRSMVQGELLLDGFVLRAPDDPLASPGTHHTVSGTDPAAVRCVRGDAELQFIAATPWDAPRDRLMTPVKPHPGRPGYGACAPSQRPWTGAPSSTASASPPRSRRAAP